MALDTGFERRDPSRGTAVPAALEDRCVGEGVGLGFCVVGLDDGGVGGAEAVGVERVAGWGLVGACSGRGDEEDEGPVHC